MNQLNEIADDYVRHARVDYVGLWQIASRINEDLGLAKDREVRRQTLVVVRQLVERGLYPGDYRKRGFRFWDCSDPDSIIARIEKEWDRLSGNPNLAHPICWFGIKPHGP